MWFADYHHLKVFAHRYAWLGSWKGFLAHFGLELSNLSAIVDPAPHQRACIAWIRALPLLAAPESGLSAEAASEILDGAQLEDSRRAELGTLRVQRARVCAPDQDPEAVLAAIDTACPGHPWAREINKP